MANTCTHIYLQFIFAVQERACLIQKTWQNKLYKYIAAIVQNNGHKLIAINGAADHVHLLIGYKPHQLIPDLSAYANLQCKVVYRRPRVYAENSVGKLVMVRFLMLNLKSMW